jgi:hypothetical protein
LASAATRARQAADWRMEKLCMVTVGTVRVR